MRRWREQYLGLAEFPAAVASAEVDQFFTLSGRELAAVGKCRGPLNRLSVGLQIGFLRMTGRMLSSSQRPPQSGRATTCPLNRRWNDFRGPGATIGGY
jgi:hypothetical protein